MAQEMEKVANAVGHVTQYGSRIAPHRIAKSSSSGRGDNNAERLQMAHSELRDLDRQPIGGAQRQRSRSSRHAAIDPEGGEAMSPLAAKRIFGGPADIRDVVDAGAAAKLAGAFAVAPHFIFVDRDRI